MPDFKGIAKGGWHPKGKDGTSKESWRRDNKGINQVAGWIGKGKDPNEKAHDHVSRPLSTLKDPAAFGPPPKNVNYYGGAALQNPDEIYAKQQAESEDTRRDAEEEVKPKGPPLPFRADTTGLSTANLPPPPGRTDGANGRSPVPAPKPKPVLPPRLPPRQNSNPILPPAHDGTPPAPDSHKGILNQGSMSRLSAAGVSVPEFGIGKGRQPLPPPRPTSPSRSSATSPSNSAQMNELQSRLSRLSSLASPKPNGASESTTYAQKQAALSTASAFRDDPSSVSIGDARAAASTANNFRERHGDQIQSGFQTANKLNSKYGIADRVGTYGGISDTQTPEPANPQVEMSENTKSGRANGVPELHVLRKKKPPPPPVKRAGLAALAVAQEPIPPPIPLSSKPKPQVGVFTSISY
jgi:hypothetical protein